MKTAVNWLEENIKDNIIKEGLNGVIVIQLTRSTLELLLKEAKEMEVRQISGAHLHGWVSKPNFKR